MASYELSESSLGGWSYVQLKLLTSSATNKIGTWTNSTGSSVTITSITIRCASGNGTFNQSTTLTGTGASFDMYLKVGSTNTETKTITAKCGTYTSGGKQTINPTNLVETTFTLLAPVTVANGSSITIYPKFAGSTPSDDKILCASASKWGSATNTGNTSHSWPKVNSGGGVYVKTSDGWKIGIPYVKTADGWKPGTAYVKTDNGWKTL